MSLSESELVEWATLIGTTTSAPLVLALRGDLGAGKSVFARAVARGAGVQGHMPSPTYNLLYRYAGLRELEVFHLDLYRLEHPEDVWELGWRELGEGPQIVLIEWPERAQALLPTDRWDITLTPDPADAARRIVHVEKAGAPPALPAVRAAQSAHSARATA
jgi:tRNA threonylcarbamoyladenosine biosynthesis protein TsaE